MKKYLRLFIILFVCFIWNLSNAANPVKIMDAAEIELALNKLSVLGGALYLAAHPDDENTALLAYLSKDRLVRTGYLSITRGEGGQNLIGSEKGNLLGVLRTQELLAARQIDGAEQFFTRARDFGYSKTPEETIEIWNKQHTLWDIVWIIRNFRPDIIITRFTPELGGHGHHRASAMLAIEAFKAAANPEKFSDQLKFVKVWKPKRVLWNTWRPSLKSLSIDTTAIPFIDLGKYNPLLGKSYEELSAVSRSMHKSQGFGTASRRGTYREYFQTLAGDSAISGLFDGVNLSWSKIQNGNKIDQFISNIIHDYDVKNPSHSLPALINLFSQLKKISENYWVEQKQKEILEIIRSCAGLWLEASASDYFVTPGEQIEVTVSALNRSEFPIELEKVYFSFKEADTLIEQPLQNNIPIQFHTMISTPKDADYSTPYWLRGKELFQGTQLNNPELMGLPENPPDITTTFVLKSGTQQFEYTIPVLYKWTDPVKGENYRSVLIVPPATAQFNEKVYVFPDNSPKEISLQIQSTTQNIDGVARLELPSNWTTTPPEQVFSFQNKEEKQTLSFTIIPPNQMSTANVVAQLHCNGKVYTYEMEQIEHLHIPIQTVLKKTETKFLRVNLKSKPAQIGYIMGSGDEIPQSLQQAGYHVSLLQENDIDKGELNQYDAIITGIRAYNTNSWLKFGQHKLLEYVHEGGTLIIQYNVNRRMVLDSLGPYPFKISRDRVTVEKAPVSLLIPNHQILNYPHHITGKDFEGWVQERGLYFSDNWDRRYETPLACNDPGENPKAGGLLITKYGKGAFIYTGYAFFRQLPAGVPGAYRLFFNLISAGEVHGQ